MLLIAYSSGSCLLFSALKLFSLSYILQDTSRVILGIEGEKTKTKTPNHDILNSHQSVMVIIEYYYWQAAVSQD